MQIKERKIAFICFHLFFRIGTFQGVMAIQTKKIQLTSAFPKIFLKHIPQPGIALSRRRSRLILPNG
jgi:hypothetical protein